LKGVEETGMDEGGFGEVEACGYVSCHAEVCILVNGTGVRLVFDSSVPKMWGKEDAKDVAP